ncbi:E3 ubiquitin-protein ligase HECTD3-like isoform X2 [Pleurodeles waltl]|uniref:E3 ubiquitin-protein ligase HECTD3-like isoform X2 n=1 Tax=Pleurodeles waltl TaxID=8319 RepID=UPI003709B9D5
MFKTGSERERNTYDTPEKEGKEGVEKKKSHKEKRYLLILLLFFPTHALPGSPEREEKTTEEAKTRVNWKSLRLAATWRKDGYSGADVQKAGTAWCLWTPLTGSSDSSFSLALITSQSASSWEQVVDMTYSVHLRRKPRIMQQDVDAVKKLQFFPPAWSYECDEDLVRFLSPDVLEEDENLGCLKQYVDRITVSSFLEESSVSCLTDNNNDTFWENSGYADDQWVRLHMKKETVVKKLLLMVNATDGSNMPKRVAVYGGSKENLKKLCEVLIDLTFTGDVCILEDMTNHVPVIEIRIVECQELGCKVYIRGIKIEDYQKQNLRMFQAVELVRYPRLEGRDPEFLYRRAIVIQRFVKMQDRVLHHIVPGWVHTVGTFNQLKFIKQFLLLSNGRGPLISQYLKDSESSSPGTMPLLQINRRLAMEHRSNPLRDPTFRNSVFNKVYEGLKQSDGNEKQLDYRWPLSYTQWWECKFTGEGLVDRGGGFRDSLADISEELCPSSANSSLPLPFFVRTPNQGNSTGEARDMYVPNPSCRDFAKYEWIGQLMGAARRGKEFLVLALPGLVWKQLTGEPVSWNGDFPAVDAVLVKLLEVMEVMDKDTFDFQFSGELMYTTVLSDQRLVELIPNGASTPVRYNDRKEFIRLVQKACLEESKEQIAAMKAGLLTVVPQAVLDLLTWQELERKVCGDPEISVEALKNFTQLQDLQPTDTRVQYFWEALNNFTNEDRSHFLRFVSGRTRLPAIIHIQPARSSSEVPDNLPESCTCSSILYLPNYTSAKVCEEKLRYAAYNCVAIDTDFVPEEE